MRIVMMNPIVASVLRRRHTTLFILRERGQEIELLFSSLKALSFFADHTREAIDKALAGQEGTEWENPSIRLRRRIRDEASDLLYEARLLERPDFMRFSRPPQVERVDRNKP